MNQKKSETFEERWNKLHDELKDISDKEDSFKRQDFLLRTSRAISWFDRAEQLMEIDGEGVENDLDTPFIFFWISFNTLYARDPLEFFTKRGKREKNTFKRYFRNLLELDKNHNHIYKTIENKKEVLGLLKNKFIDPLFWDYYHKYPLKREEEYPNWDRKKRTKSFDDAKKETEPNTLKMLTAIFGRLYTLRNQIMHGGSAWKEYLKRGQLSDATKIMHELLSVFIDLMLDNPEADWGGVFYPRVLKKPIIDPGDQLMASRSTRP